MPTADSQPLTDEQLATAFPGQDLAHVKSMMGVANGDGEFVSPNADGDADTTTDDTSDTVTYPDYIPAKFQNGTVAEAHAAMAAGYTSLETKMGTQSGKPDASQTASADAGGTTDEETGDGDTSTTGTSLADVEAAYVENGEVPEAIYEEYEAKGMPRDTLDAYLTGQKAIANQMVTSVHAEVGGQEAYVEMIKWAETNWSEDEVNAFDTIVTSGDKAAAMVAVRGLKAGFAASTGKAPNLVPGQGNGAPQGNAFQSRAEMVAAMSDPKYKTDPAYRKTVEERVGISDIW